MIRVNGVREAMLSLGQDGMKIETPRRLTRHSVSAAWMIAKDIFRRGTQEERDQLLNLFVDEFGKATLCNSIIESFKNTPDDITELFSVLTEAQDKAKELNA